MHEFFSDESNSENTLKIIEEIKNRKAEFINNPQEFCAQIISSTLSPTEEQKNKFQPEAPLFVTSQDLCYKAIDEGDQEKLKKLLPHAIKLDKDFLTNALCYAVLNNKDSITATLINDYKADPKKTSTLYEETAEKIANNLDKTLPQPKIKTSVSKDEILIRDDKIEIKVKDKKSSEKSVIIDLANNNFIKLDQIKGELEIKEADFKKELMDYCKGQGKYKSRDIKIDKSALQAFNLYNASPSGSFQPKDATRVFTVTKQKTPL